MKTGTVKWFNEKKGFGFIESEERDYFVYYKDINTAGFKTLRDGQAVNFEPSPSERGFAAKNVTLV